ncbi:MAG: ATP-binding protein [bacterium]|jgi:signal transduction histidine kinase
MDYTSARNFFMGTLRRQLVAGVALVHAVVMMGFIAAFSLREGGGVLTRMVWDGLIYAGLAIIVGSLMAMALSTFFVRRMKVIQAVMESVRDGNINARVVLSGGDEAAALASGFNQMLETLQQRAQEIILLNANLEKHLAERTHQLQCTNKELVAFAYSVSHDLRAPLRAMDGFSGFLEEGYGDKLDDEGRRLLGIIRSNSRKMDRLITDLLTLSRTTQGELLSAKIDMFALVNEVYNKVVSEEIRRQFQFTLRPLPSVWGDPVLLRQVWVNLISNAIKYTMKSSVKAIEVGGDLKNGEAVYYIKDTGAGFNPEYAGKLFGAFQRLHKAEEFEGTGIGLAIVQRIIHRHEGHVWAEGKEHAGATFSFAIPDKTPPA